ncbi:MAG: BON domain-containing protein [Blastocatellia bacterium]
MFRTRPLALILLTASLAATLSVQAMTAPQSRIIKEIRHELVTLPYYGVFDWLEGEIRPDGTVVLRGETVRPSTKKEAESRLKSIEGIDRVINEIEVLPASSNDDRLRRSTFRALFNDNSPLFRYATQAVPPIHIIIKNGRATLKGVVATSQDKQLAYIKARGVPGLFEVKNELRVESEGAH